MRTLRHKPAHSADIHDGRFGERSLSALRSIANDCSRPKGDDRALKMKLLIWGTLRLRKRRPLIFDLLLGHLDFPRECD